MSEVRRYVPRILRDDGMIEAQEVAHYTHLNLSQYVLASDYDALAARLAECEQVKAEAIAHAAGLSSDLTGMGERLVEAEQEAKDQKAKQEALVTELNAIKATVGDTEYSLRQQLAEAQATVARQQDRIDLQCDEFQRIAAIAGNDEIKGLCDRAVKDIRQHVPVIQQRDQAEQQVARLRECSNNLVAFLIQNHEDVGIELYGRVNGTVPTPSATRLNELLASIQHALRETGAA